MKDLYTVEQTADLLSVSTKTIRRLIKSGDIPHVRIGRAVRLNSQEIEDWVRYNTHYSDNMHLACSNYPNCDTEGCGEH
jgi:excisionase family DNA binding protein